MRKGRTHHRTRRGVGFVLTLIFISIFACMAVAMAATAQSNMVIARNRTNAEQSLAMAQGGLCLMLKNLGGAAVTGTSATALSQVIGQQLKTSLATSSMLNANNITWDAAGVHVPTATVTRADGSSGQFTVTLLPNGAATSTTTIAITCIGSFGGASHTITYKMGCQNAASAFDFGIAAQGGVNATNTFHISGASGHPSWGDILSGGNVSLANGSSVSGDVNLVNSSNSITAPVGAIQGNKVYGNSESWPTVDPTVFKQYATNVVSTNQNNATLSNVIIPPNSNINFSGTTVITGILYIQSPNKIQFNGPLTITGCIAADTPSPLNLNNNQIKFTQTVSSSGVDQLPAGSQYNGLRNLTGTFLMAPGYSVEFDNNVGVVNGGLYCSQLTINNALTGTFKGPIMVLNGGTLSSNNTVNITVDRSTNLGHAGVTINQSLVCISGSYAE